MCISLIGKLPKLVWAEGHCRIASAASSRQHQTTLDASVASDVLQEEFRKGNI